jgi:hypothetical protein
MSTFKVGDECEWQNLEGKSAVYNGQPCTVVGGLHLQAGRGMNSGLVRFALHYTVVDSDGEWLAEPQDLRRRRGKLDWVALCKLNDIKIGDIA